MLNLPTNITKRERMARGALGAILIIFAFIGLAKVAAILLGIILIAEAALSYCAVIDIIERFKLDSKTASNDNINNFPPDNKPPL